MRNTELFVLIVVVGCGARSAIDRPGEARPGGTGGAPATTSTSTSGGMGGEGGGVVEVACRSLEWAGGPVFISYPSGGTVEQLDIVRVANDAYAVVVRLDEGALDVVASQAVFDPFGSWPPTLGLVDVNFPTEHPVAFTAFEPGEFGFAARDVSVVVLGGSVPGENGSTFVDLPIVNQDLHFAARSALGAYLIGTGLPTFVDVHLVDRYEASPRVTTLTPFGCADVMPAAAASPFVGAEGFWVVNAADLPFDDCLDPDLPGPALYANLRRIEGDTVFEHSFKQSTEHFVELDVSAAADGAYVGIRVGDRREYSVYRDDFDMAVGTLVPDLQPGEHAIASMGDGVAVAEVVSTNAQPGGEVRLRFIRADTSATSLEGPLQPPIAHGEPAMVTSVEPASILLAYAQESLVVLARADCVE